MLNIDDRIDQIASDIVKEFHAIDRLAVHYSSAIDEWATPQFVIDAAKEVMGGIELDPASSHAAQASVGAKRYYTHHGLERSWKSPALWHNPPYGREIGPWVEKWYQGVRDHTFDQGMLLIPARTDTKWFRPLYALDRVLFCWIYGRLCFGAATNAAPFPSVLVYTYRYGEADKDNFIEVFGQYGAVCTFGGL